jgi:hypothetical protein
MAQAKGVRADVEFLSSDQVLRALEADFFDGLSGGDWVYVPGYTARGPVCLSWGRRQQMSWALPDFRFLTRRGCPSYLGS